ncbi:MAG TPA: hypothetical protein VFV52_11145 [Bacilli bacterium]|nr:hypothetical protein [Bacilli bacterium]
MNSVSVKIDFPRLRHCTFVIREANEPIIMVIGQDYFEINEEFGSREKFLEVKRYFDGRHSIKTISEVTGVAEDDVREIVEAFAELGVLRMEEPLEKIPTDVFLKRIQDSCIMWGRQIGYHRLYGGLERGEYRKEVFLGLILETYHYVKSATKHISVALAHCTNPVWQKILTEYLQDEHDHEKLFENALVQMGMPLEWVQNSHPIIGTMSLTNMLCEIGKASTFAYMACTNLFEAREEDFENASGAFEQMARQYGYDESVIASVIEHMAGDIEAGHKSLLAQALEETPFVDADLAHLTVNFLHDLKHSYDQFHDQILDYYSDISNYIPRLKVDYFSL